MLHLLVWMYCWENKDHDDNIKTFLRKRKLCRGVCDIPDKCMAPHRIIIWMLLWLCAKICVWAKEHLPPHSLLSEKGLFLHLEYFFSPVLKISSLLSYPRNCNSAALSLAFNSFLKLSIFFFFQTFSKFPNELFNSMWYRWTIYCYSLKMNYTCL